MPIETSTKQAISTVIAAVQKPGEAMSLISDYNDADLLGATLDLVSVAVGEFWGRILGTVYLIDACLLSVTLSPWHASHEL